MGRLQFYFQYAFRNIQRGGRWTTLAILCIAAGVATVVALRSLGLAIGETLVNNTRIDNKGDILLTRDGGPESALTFGSEDVRSFEPATVDAVRDFVQERGGRMSAFTTGGAVQIAGIDGESGGFGTLSLIETYLIDPQTYPPTHDIDVIEPAGAALDDVFTAERSIVISENMARQQDIALGDSVRVARTDDLFTVTGIVATEAEAGINNIFSAFFGFAYLKLETAQAAIDENIGVNNLALVFEPALTEQEANDLLRDLYAQTPLSRNLVEEDIAAEELETRQEIAQALSDFIVVLGLGALLIGGVGIMNTMLVLVRRRTTEIAAVKTFGMKARDVGMLFFTEGLLLGIFGSIIGCVVGVGISGIVNQFGEQFLQQPLVWRIHPQALLYGFLLGIIITSIFGLAPILTALQVRPAIILRPNETHTPGLGLVQTGVLMIVVTLIIGLVVGQIISPTFGLSSSLSPTDPYLYGIIGVAAALAFLGVLTGILWGIIWLVGKLPSFGNIDLKLALRNLSTHRLRTATTLLALSAGMFALSSITFVGEGTRQLLNVQLSRSFGGNVLAFPLIPGGINQTLNQLTQQRLSSALDNVDGVQAETRIANYQAKIVSIDGREVDAGFSGENDSRFGPPDDPEATAEATPAADDDAPLFFGDEGDNTAQDNADAAAADDDASTGDDNEVNPFDEESIAPFTWGSLSVWDSTDPDIFQTVTTVVQGRTLTPDDRGQRVAIGPVNTARVLGIEVGSQITYRLRNQEYTFEVVGLTESSSAGFGNNVYLPPDTLEGTLPAFQLFSYQVDDAQVSEAVVELSSINLPRVFALDVGIIDSLISRLINQFAAIPTVVGVLSLFAAAVIMANTVALSSLERRRQIGILKSLGLKSNRVLLIMLIESSIIGLLSGVIGIGLSVVFVTIATSQFGTTIPFPRDARLAALALLVAAVVIGWVATFLSANIAVRERVMNVLRYE